MKATIEKICDAGGIVFYRVSMEMQNGTIKIEKFPRLFDAKNGAKKFEEEALKYRIAHSGYTAHEKFSGIIDE